MIDTMIEDIIYVDQSQAFFSEQYISAMPPLYICSHSSRGGAGGDKRDKL